MLQHGDVWNETGLSDTGALLILNLVSAVTMESSNHDTSFKKASKSVAVLVVLSHIHEEYGKRNAVFTKCDAPTGDHRSLKGLEGAPGDDNSCFKRQGYYWDVCL